jgi:hypothetical protein
MPKYFIFDIDHTISNSFWRDGMIGTSSWDDYHEASKNDYPFIKVINLINSLYNQGYAIICITGRPEKFRSLTVDWLLDYKVEVDELLMRPDDCFLKNQELKIKLVEDHFKKYYKDIQFIVDNNEEVCLEFAKLGISSLQIRNISGGTR